MNILHVTQLYHPSKGGTQTHIKGLSEQLVRWDQEVSVFAARALENRDLLQPNGHCSFLPEFETVNGVGVRRFTVNAAAQEFLFHRVQDVRGGYRFSKMVLGDYLPIMNFGPFVPRMMAEIIKDNPDIIMAANMSALTSLFAVWAASIGRIPLIIMPCLHVYDTWADLPGVYKLIQRAEAVIALTPFEKRYLMAHGIREDKIHVIGAGIEPPKAPKDCSFAFMEKYRIEHPVVTYLGRLIESKGIETLLKAMKQLWDRGVTAQLLIAGKSQLDYVAELEHRMDVILSPTDRQRVIVIEDFDDREKTDILAASDMLVLPSKTESFGIVFLEAWSVGVPCLACRETACADVVEDQHDGLLFEYDHHAELAAKIQALIENPERRKQLGANGREKVLKHYTWDQVGTRILNVYRSLVNTNQMLGKG